MDITPEQQKQLEEIGKKYNLKLLLLHGSYATGKQHPGSDLDVAYLPAQPFELEQQLALHSKLADIFGDNQERELDLKSVKHTNPLFLWQVARDSQLLYGSEAMYRDFRLHAEMMYYDTRDLRKLEHLLTRRLLHKLRPAHARF